MTKKGCFNFPYFINKWVTNILHYETNIKDLS